MLDAPPGGGLLLGARSLFRRLTEGGVAGRALSGLLGTCPASVPGAWAGKGAGLGSSWAAPSCAQRLSPAKRMLLACWHPDMLRGAFLLTRPCEACMHQVLLNFGDTELLHCCRAT